MYRGGLSKRDEDLNDEIVEEHQNMPKQEMAELKRKVGDFKYALSEVELKQFCHKNGMMYAECDIQELTDPSKMTKPCYFVFTGTKPDKVNSGNDHHWLYLYYDHLFDPAGDKYGVASHIKMVKTHPSQLQNFQSVVCGKLMKIIFRRVYFLFLSTYRSILPCLCLLYERL